MMRQTRPEVNYT